MLKLRQPVAITMWDFSWLERRWPGAGYEDWNIALDELAERGYDAVRIDAYPHFLAWDPDATWELLPTWHFLDWGAAMKVDVRVMPALTDFLAACRARGIRVGLSTWFREDARNVRMRIADASILADIWIATLARVRDAGLLDAVLYVDFCNEWPGDRWAPFFKNDPPSQVWNGNTPKSRSWMSHVVAQVRREFPTLPMTFSFWPDVQTTEPLDFSFLDLFEPHIWLAQQNDFYRHVGYGYEAFDIKGMEAVAANAAAVYRAGKRFHDAALTATIDRYAEYSRKTHRGLITTECWGPVDYKDGPRLDWGWVKESCELGTTHAAATGRWLGIATSNFCAPQFIGMWRDIAWHQRLTKVIKSSRLEAELLP
jgi:hypothetical protein